MRNQRRAALGRAIALITILAVVGAACGGDDVGELRVDPAASDLNRVGVTTSLISPTTSASPTTTATPANPADRVVGYYAGWSQTPRPVSEIPSGSLTHLVYAFADVTVDSECVLLDDVRERALIEQVQAWKTTANVVTLLGIGGFEHSGNFSEASATANSRAALASSCVDLAQELGFDGIDMDWEYPAQGRWGDNPADTDNYVALLAEVRARLDPDALLTVASPAIDSLLDTFALGDMNTYVDWFNIMAYDFSGAWEDTTGHNAPIASPSRSFGAAAGIDLYLQADIPASKLSLGMPFYGRLFAEVVRIDGNAAGIGQRFDGVPVEAPSGSMTYDAISALVNDPQWIRHYDEVAQVPWLTNPDTSVLVSYDDPQSIVAKVELAQSYQLGGVMAWDLGSDDRGFSLLRAMNEALGRPTT